MYMADQQRFGQVACCCTPLVASCPWHQTLPTKGPHTKAKNKHARGTPSHCDAKARLKMRRRELGTPSMQGCEVIVLGPPNKVVATRCRLNDLETWKHCTIYFSMAFNLYNFDHETAKQNARCSSMRVRHIHHRLPALPRRGTWFPRRPSSFRIFFLPRILTVRRAD